MKKINIKSKLIIPFLLTCIVESGFAEGIKVMTFNTGTHESEAKRNADPDEYGRDDAKLSDKYYGNGLAWLKAIDAATEFFAETQPDIVGFQEMFHPSKCKDIPKDAHREFICETWQPGDPSVVNSILGSGYQVACHKGTTEKCIAVRKEFGSIKGCDEDICLDFLEPAMIKNCSGHSRLGRAQIQMKSGGEVNVVHIHASSGFKGDDKSCRKKQFRKIFEDYGDGEPGINGDTNIVLGDFNTDPRRLWWFDSSANKLKKFAKKSEINHHTKKTKASYGGFITLDHVFSDSLDAKCEMPGITKNTSPVMDEGYFDHTPTICNLN